MKYRKILNFIPREMIDSLRDTYDSYLLHVSVAAAIRKSESSLPSTIDISLPNISLVIGGTYDRNANEVMFNDEILVEAQTNEVMFYSDSDPLGISDTTVLISTQFESGIPIMAERLLKRGSNGYTVSWFYNSEKVDTTALSNSHSIPPFKYASERRFLKRGDFFQELNSVSTTPKATSVTTFGIADNNLNRLDNPNITCVPIIIAGSTISISKDACIISRENTSLSISKASISRTVPIRSNSLISTEEAEKNILMRSLKNAKKLFILERESYENNHVVTTGYVDAVSSFLFPKNRKNIPLNSRVIGSEETSICSNSSFVELVRAKASDTYSTILKDTISGKDGSTLGELLQYLSDKIDDMNKNFVKSDECKSISPSSVDEGCKLGCDTLSLSDDNLMVTKQKLKATIKCALSCR